MTTPVAVARRVASAAATTAAPSQLLLLRQQRRGVQSAPGVDEREESVRDSTTWLTGRETQLDRTRTHVHRKATESIVGEQPRVDYLQRFEEEYGAKETWHRGDEDFMRKVMPVLCRKVDDLRERIVDLHRYQRLYRTATQKELRKIPLYKREAWMSPDLTRSLLLEELRGKGYLDDEGRLKDLPALGPAAPPSKQLPAEGGSGSGAPVPVTGGGERQLPASAGAASVPVPVADVADEVAEAAAAAATAAVAVADFSAEVPTVVDPLTQDVHAPHFSAPPAAAPVVPAGQYFKPPPRGTVQRLADATGGVPDGVEKVWVELRGATVEARLDDAGRIRAVAPVGRDAGRFMDPAERVYGADGAEVGAVRAEAAAGAEEVDREGEEEEDVEQYDGQSKGSDPVYRGLMKEGKRRRRHQSDVWGKINDPEVPPGRVVHDLVLQQAGEMGSVPLAQKLSAAEDMVTAPEHTFDLVTEYPAMPEVGPDAMDKYNLATQVEKREAVLNVQKTRAQIKRGMNPSHIQGASFVDTLPTNEDRLAYQHTRASSTGVWYTMSTVPGYPGRPIDPEKKWPETAVEVPFAVHEAATKGHGYSATNAHQEILRLTTPETHEVDPDYGSSASS